jgi:hypothetical protein
VNSFTTGEQGAPAIGADASGNFVVVWESEDQDGDGWGIFAQRFESPGCLDPPGLVTDLQVEAINAGADLRLTWTDTTHADSYVVFEDLLPDGGFETQTGTAAGGAAGLTTPTPAATTYYLVAGSNASCGAGPR